MSRDLWVPGRYQICSMVRRAHEVTGYTYKGLGMRMEMRGSRKGRRPPSWNVTHLNSGHKVVTLNMPEALAFKVATEVADVGDWDFGGLHGYKNRDPDLRDKVSALLSSYGVVSFGGPNHDDEAARQITQSRM